MASLFHHLQLPHCFSACKQNQNWLNTTIASPAFSEANDSSWGYCLCENRTASTNDYACCCWKSWSLVLSLTSPSRETGPTAPQWGYRHLKADSNSLYHLIPVDTGTPRLHPNICILFLAEWRCKGIFFSSDQNYFPCKWFIFPKG